MTSAPSIVVEAAVSKPEWLAAQSIAEQAGLDLQVETKFNQPHILLLIARAQGSERVDGFALLVQLPDEIELLDMAVRPERRRLGFGRALVKALVEAGQTRGSRAIFLEVRRSNAAAQKLYRALGFNALSVRHDYYAAPREDAIIMSMNFDSPKAAPLPVTRTQREHHTVPLLRRESFGSLYHVLTFDAQQPVMAEAGQFAMVRGAEWGDSPLLPRPMSYLTAGSRPSILIKVVGDGTSRMAHAEPGELFTLLGPLGNRWRAPRPERTPVLVAGGVGVAPLLFLARELHAKGQRSIVLYGGRSERDLPLRDDLASVSDLRMITEDGSCGEKGRVPDLLRDLLKTPVDVFTCGPDRMMAAVAELCGQANVPCEASLETPMACGYGVCLGCPVLTTSGQYLYACVEGPCVDAQRIDWNKAGHAPVRKSTFPGAH